MQVVVPEPVSGLEPSGRFISGDKRAYLCFSGLRLLSRLSCSVASRQLRFETTSSTPCSERALTKKCLVRGWKFASSVSALASTVSRSFHRPCRTSNCRFEPPRVFARLIRLNHFAVTGPKNRVSTIGSTRATPGPANLRRKVGLVVMRLPRFRHGFARSRHSLTPTASGLMTVRPPRQRRYSSESQPSQRKREMGSAIVCDMGRSQATTAEVHNYRQRLACRRLRPERNRRCSQAMGASRPSVR